MRSAWLVGVVGVILWAASPVQAAVVSVDADGLMDVQAPEGGNLVVECYAPGTDRYCDVRFASGVGGVVTGVAPGCLPQTLPGTVRCSDVSARDVTMGSGADTLTISSSYTPTFGQRFGGRIDMGAGDDTIHLGESYGSDVVVAGAGTDTVSYEKRFSPLTITTGGGAGDGTGSENDDIHAEVVEGGRGDDALTDSSAGGAVTFLGGLGNDVITGGAGADTLDGQSGDDAVHGLGGDDVLVARDGRADVVECGGGSDSATGDRIDEVTGCETEDLGPAIQLSVGDVSVAEDSGQAVLTITASGANARAMSVTVTPAGGTATAGEDFAAPAVTATVPAGQRSTQVAIPVVGDALDEADSETFTVVLVEPVEAVIADGEATVTVTDDDDPPAVTLDAIGDVTEGAVATVTARLATESGFPVSVELGSAPGGAGAEDFAMPSPATIQIPAGSRTGTLSVPTVDDGIVETDETFTLTIASASRAVPAGEPAAVRILDNDADRPVLSIADAPVKEGGKLTARLTLSRAASEPVTVRVTTADGTAGAPGDYTAFDGTVTIPAGERKASVVLRIAGDGIREPDETFTVVLTEAVNAALGRSTATMTIQDGGRPR